MRRGNICKLFACFLPAPTEAFWSPQTHQSSLTEWRFRYSRVSSLAVGLILTPKTSGAEIKEKAEHFLQSLNPDMNGWYRLCLYLGCLAVLFVWNLGVNFHSCFYLERFSFSYGCQRRCGRSRSVFQVKSVPPVFGPWTPVLNIHRPDSRSYKVCGKQMQLPAAPGFTNAVQKLLLPNPVIPV